MFSFCTIALKFLSLVDNDLLWQVIMRGLLKKKRDKIQCSRNIVKTKTQ